MRTKNLYKLSVLVVMLALVALPLAGQSRRGGPAQTGIPAIAGIPETVSVTGSVKSVDFQYSQGYPSFELAAGGVSYVIYVGPLWYLDDNDFELQVNDEVTASIFRDRLSNDVWVASVLVNLTAGGQTLTLRDASGFPLWISRGNKGHAGFGSGRMGNNAGQTSMMRRGQGTAALRAGQPSIDLSTLDEYSGIVTKVDIAAGETHPAVEVELESGTALFCLAPYRYLDQIGFAVKTGDSVQIKAADCAQNAEEYVVFSITVNGIPFVLRSDDGTPSWYFGRRN